MANTYHQIYIQAVFAVKYRESLLLPNIESEVREVIGALINETGCKNILVNGTPDHIHCFLGLKPTVSISELMKTVKSKSSKHINDHHLTPHRFEWQCGYGVFSYNQAHIEEVYNYIKNQKQHHQCTSFADEYRAMLVDNKIPFKEQYLFDELV